MNRHLFISLSVLFLIFIAGVCVFLYSGGQDQHYAFNPNEGKTSEIVRSSNGVPVFLYFADRNKPVLKTEERILSNTDNTVVFARSIVDSLIKGPQNGLMRTLPAGTVLKALYVTNKNIAFADFSQEISDNHPGGSQLEYLTIYSIVNSLILNVPKIEKVKILIEGQEQSSLAGHIDLHLPFSANMLIVR